MAGPNRRRRREIRNQLPAWPKRRIAAWVLMGLAVVVAVQHLLAHGGFRPIPIDMGLQDLLIGYPMAAVLALAGAMLLPAHPGR